MINIKQSRILFTPLSGFFFIFPSQYLFTIGNKFRYLALRSGHRRFTQNSPCFVLLGTSIVFSTYFTTGLSPYFASRNVKTSLKIYLNEKDPSTHPSIIMFRPFSFHSSLCKKSYMLYIPLFT